MRRFAGRLGGGLIALLGVVSTPSEGHAGRMPGWAEAVQAAAPALAPGVPVTATRVLLSEMRVTVRPDGTRRLRRRMARQILSTRTGGLESDTFHFDDRTRVRAARAWHVPPGESARRSFSTPLDLALDPGILTDIKTRIISVAGIRKGSLVFFEFEGEEDPFTLASQWYFYEGEAPIDVARYEVEVPEGWTMRHAWLRTAGTEPMVTGPVRAWEVRNLVPPPEEPWGYRGIDRAPLLITSLVPPSPAGVRPAVIPDWVSLAHWFEALAAGRHTPTPEVGVVAARLAAEAGPDPGDQIRATAKYVRDQVRYVAREVGIGGYQPRPCGQVLRELLGDCKDKGTLLRALLAAQGRTTYPIFVHATLGETVADAVPSLGSFNHFVIAVAWPAGLPVPGTLAAAAVDGGPLGRLVILDATDEATSPGAMSAALSGRRGFLAAGAESRVLVLPGGHPGDHQIRRRLHLELLPAGDLRVRMEAEFFGAPAAAARSAWRASPRDRQRETEAMLRDFWSGAVASDYAVDEETPAGAFVETVTWSVAGAALANRAALVPVFPLPKVDLQRLALGRRKGGVRFEHALQVDVDSVLRGFPLPVEPAPAQEHMGEGWTLRSEQEARSGELQARIRLSVAQSRYEPTEFPSLEQLWSRLERVMAPAISLAD